MATNIFQSAGPAGLNMEGLGMLTKHCMSMSCTSSFLVFGILTYVTTSDPGMKGEDFVEVSKVAEIALFLCSDAAQVVNGAVWTADGGVTAH